MLTEPNMMTGSVVARGRFRGILRGSLRLPSPPNLGVLLLVSCTMYKLFGFSRCVLEYLRAILIHVWALLYCVFKVVASVQALVIRYAFLPS